MPKLEDIERRALELDGTPFRHQGRVPGVGLDCIGVLVCAVGDSARVVDVTDYPADPPGDRLLQLLEQHAVELPQAGIDAVPAGAICTFWEGREDAEHVRHVAIRTRSGIVHAIRERPTRAVSIGAYWRRHFWRAYRWC